MAVVEPVRKPIKAHQYVTDSIAYVLSPENRHGDEKCFKATCLNCDNGGAEDLAKQFFEIRRAFKKDRERLAHHYVQSFSPNEKVTPELAHQIGVELAEKIAPGFQVVVSTHIDRDHIHNHIILNSVNPSTGMKWVNNKTSLYSIWQESDKLCQQYGLTTIKKKSGLRGIDQTTQKLAEKGESWKVALCKALDEAVILCCNKGQLFEFMKRKGFEITRYTDRHITFRKIGETKKIRANTLAEQFGKKYTKEILERKMGFYKPPAPLENPPTPKLPIPFVSEFEKYEQNYFKENPPPSSPDEAKGFQQKIQKSHNPFFLLLLIIHRLMFRQIPKPSLDAKYERMHSKIKKLSRYKTKEPDLRIILERYKKKPAVTGNILYKDLINAQGENFRIKLSLSAIPKLYAYPFFFSAKLYNDYALVTIKERDKKLFMQILEKGTESVINRQNAYYTPMADYQILKKRAAQLGVKVEFLMIEPEQLELLKDDKDRFVSIETKDGKIRLAFLPQNKDFILHSLYPDKYKSKSDTLFSVARNTRINKLLKARALLDGQKMRYRTMTKEQVEQLAEETKEQELFAVFDKKANGENLNGQYNVAFKEDDQKKIEEALQKPKTKKRKI